MPRLDEIDRQILATLLRDGRASWKQLADAVGLSAPSVLERVRKLERSGVIRGYGAQVDPEQLGVGLLAFVAVVGNGPEFHARLGEEIGGIPEVLECHVTDGEFDYLLKLRCRDSRHLMRVLQRLRGIAGILSTRTTVSLATLKETGELPLGPD